MPPPARLDPTSRANFDAQPRVAPASSANGGNWISFTLATAVLVGDLHGAKNVKMDDYVYLIDPLGRALTLAGAAIHLRNYDKARPSPSLAERFAILAGGIITPAAGIGVGASWMLVRGFALNTGVAMLLVNEAKHGKEAASIVETADYGAPFQVGLAYGWFVGGNYTFGR